MKGIGSGHTLEAEPKALADELDTGKEPGVILGF
jgi:hypothetical protein